MVEGHSVHRVAAAHRAILVGKAFAASSPNGRFAHGAALINGQVFASIEAVGKNLFAFFGRGKSQVVVHVHFGMSGQWSVFDSTAEPETTKTTRLRLSGHGLVSHLSAMTVAEGDKDMYDTKRAALGEDPLRSDADPEGLWRKVCVSNKSIGALVMDQSFFCGPGNIYRAEILFKAGVHPDVKGSELQRSNFDDIWRHAVDLLRRGFESGSIVTVDDDIPDRRYVYGKQNCSRCGGRVTTWQIAARTAYACVKCQPRHVASRALPPSIEYTTTRVPSFAKLSRPQLQAELKARGAESSGTKAQLIARLEALPMMRRTAFEAAQDKAVAGESRSVEHVAELHPSQAAAAQLLTPQHRTAPSSSSRSTTSVVRRRRHDDETHDRQVSRRRRSTRTPGDNRQVAP